MKSFRELHAFEDPALLDQAMTHPSYANEHPGTPTYQRLEFLGDAVLQLVASQLLLTRFPDLDEGGLSKARARLVDRTHCAELAGDLGIPAALRTERGLAGGVAPGSKVLADAFEALVAAIYVDGGLEAARAAISPLLAKKADALDVDMLKDAKSELQEQCQARKLPLPLYEDHGHSGPDHARVYHVTVTVAGVVYGPGSGRKKQVAEAAAARIALAATAVEPD
jgi:ribonuclease-3